ncbi:MAG: minichromosome maintenance protein MCM [Candidatus Diapherotrites archaeon]
MAAVEASGGQETEIIEGGSDNPFVSKWEAFLKSQYKKEIEGLVSDYPEKRSLYVDFREIEHFDYELADELLANPDYVLDAAKSAVAEMDVPSLDASEFKPHVRIFNLPKDSETILRNISSDDLGKLISVEGVIRQMTDVLPKLKTAVWECRRCGSTYKDVQKEQNIRQPWICGNCKHKEFTLKSEDSDFEDYQKVMIQEPLELIRSSEQATTIDVYVNDDMVNRVVPGDRTRIVGILRLRPPKDKNVVYGRYLEAVHTEETAKEFEKIEVTKDEEKEIRKLAAKPDIYHLLVQSIAPAIYGHEIVKESIVLQLFGGVKKVLPGDQKIRGNIHVLLVGEPGMAKSAMLQAVNKIAPKGIYVAGKTTTGAGLSATAVKDEFGEGGWTLKAGALVLASGGMCMVDEMDKMADEDRSALHESMEQSSISVAKAGIVTRFKSDTSILAAANPKYSRFDPYKNYLEQLDLPPTLISRFDLFFMIKDVLDRKKDEEIANHILRTHQVGEMLLMSKRKGIAKNEAMEEMERAITPAIEVEMLKKYISYARQNIFPVLGDERIKELSDFYVNLREQGKKAGSYAATHRQLEALVRLSEASARVRLSEEVEKQDVDLAMRIFRTSLQDLVTDQETGRIDIDLITTGQTQSQREHLMAVLNIIREKSRELDMVPIEDVIEESKTKGMDSEKVRDMLSKLKRAGDIYEPRHGFVNPVSKR